MTRQIPWLLLALSMLFNVFFAAGYYESRSNAGAGQPGESDALLQQVARQLDLNDDQREMFTQLRRGFAEEEVVYRQSVELLRQELAEELSRTEPDLQRVRSIIEQQSDLRKEFRQAGSERFNRFLQVLTPEQRERLSSRMHRGSKWKRYRSRWLLEKFDKDGDGELSDEERAAAREAMEQRRRDFKDRRMRFQEHFDRDDDGQIDDEERQRMLEFDEDGDGRLDHDERRKLWRSMRQQREGG